MCGQAGVVIFNAVSLYRVVKLDEIKQELTMLEIPSRLPTITGPSVADAVALTIFPTSFVASTWSFFIFSRSRVPMKYGVRPEESILKCT